MLCSDKVFYETQNIPLLETLYEVDCVNLPKRKREKWEGQTAYFQLIKVTPLLLLASL